MLHALDMRTVLIEGAFVCFIIAIIMAYHSVTRKTYPGFHYWTVGFVNAGIGGILIATRGFIPLIFSIVIANVLIITLPFLLSYGLSIFLGVQWRHKVLCFVVMIFFMGVLVFATYVWPSLSLRTISFSVVFIVLLGESLWITNKYLPLVLGEKNMLFFSMVLLSIVATGCRLFLPLLQSGKFTFLANSGALQSILILMTILSTVGIMASLIILNAQRLEIELKAANRQIEILAHHDSLTGLYNRRYFDSRLEQEFNRLQRTAQPLSLVIADIDFFKKYNDTYGHLAGDDCIRAIGEACQAAARRGSDIAARYGGEEFVLLLPNTERQGAGTVAQDLSAFVRDKAIPHATSSVAPVVTVSIGVATIVPCRSSAPDMLIHLADQALYESKLSGRNMIKSRFLNPSVA